MTLSPWARRIFGIFLALALPAILFAAQVQLPQKAVLFPGTSGVIKDTAAFYNAATKEGNLLLLRAAIFDPLRDGRPDLDAWVPDRISGQPLDNKYYIVQSKTVLTPGFQRQLASAGAQVLDYIPNNALMVRMNTAAYNAVVRNPEVRWVGDYQPGFKMGPFLALNLNEGLTALQGDKVRFAVAFFTCENVSDAVNEISSRFHADRNFNYRQDAQWTVVFQISREAAAEFVACLANRNDVRWIEPNLPAKLMNDNSVWMCQSADSGTKATPIFAHGIMGQGQVVAMSDSGIDRESCFFIHAEGAPQVNNQHVTPPGVLAIDTAQRKLLAVNIMADAIEDDSGVHWYHGTHTSGSVAGKDYHSTPSPGTGNAAHLTGDGMAPMAKLIMEGGGTTTGGLNFPYPLYDLWQQERLSTARLSSNSWGVQIDYPGYSNEYLDTNAYDDLFVWHNEDFLICWSTGNVEDNALLNNYSLGKNVIGVGATTNGSAGANDVWDYSCKGPAADGRYKPDLVAPGMAVRSAAGSTGAACNTKTGSGTSMACPTVAGLAALVRQYYTEGWYPSGAKTPADAFTPSAALVKATLINSARNLTGGNTGAIANEDAPAGGQGWGRPLLDDALYFATKADARKLCVADVPNAAGLTTGETREYTYTVAAGMPFKVSLVWADAPAAYGVSQTLVNNLDLEVEGPGGVLYKGNQWNGTPSNNTKESAANPAGTDTINNVEGVLLRTPAAGTYKVRVKGTNIPGFQCRYTQGYALVATGDVTGTDSAVLNIVGIDVDDSLGNNNHIVDPGEEVRLTVRLGNYGAVDAGSINAVLSTTTTGVTVTGANSAYPNINVGRSAANSTPFSFRVAGNVPMNTVIHLNLAVNTSSSSATLPLSIRVKPSSAPVLSNLVLTEGERYETDNGVYPQYVSVRVAFNYADPEADYDKMYLFTRIGGVETNALPTVLDNETAEFWYNTPGTSGSTEWNIRFFFHVASSNLPAGRIQVYGYLVDTQGNWSPMAVSNELNFTIAQTATTPLQLQDDDTTYVAFPTGFTFPFYGQTYSGCWLNTDGNITFGGGYAWMDRTPSAFLNEMPRIAALYTDLAKDPGQDRIQVSSTANTVSFTFANLPQWAQSGPTGSHNFVVTLHNTGAIDVAYGRCDVTESQEDYLTGLFWKAIVGVCPGGFPSTFPSTDLSAFGGNITIPAGDPIYQGFQDTDSFDLANSTIFFNPPAFTPTQTLIFPRLSYKGGDRSEGLGFVNPTGKAARIRFSGYNLTGGALGTQNTMWWPIDGQGAYQAESVLGLSADSDGWVMAEADQTGIKGFFLSEKFGPGGLAGMDGASAFLSTEAMADGYFPRVMCSGGFTTELFIANPGNDAAAVTLVGLNGTTTINAPIQNIPAKGAVKLDVATGFGQPFNGAIHLTATGSQVVGNAQVRFGTTAISSCNLMPTSGAATNLTAAHITSIPTVYATEANIVNTGATPAVVTLTPYNADGTAMTPPFTVNVPAGQVVNLKDAQLGLPTTGSSDGWLNLASDGSPILGCLSFGKPDTYVYESTLPLQTTTKTTLYFSQVANGNAGGVNFFTGITLVNPGNAYANVVVAVYGSDGRLYGQANVTLKPKEKFARLLQTLENMGTIPDQASGYIEITSSQPIYGFELFGDWTFSFLSAVTAQ